MSKKVLVPKFYDTMSFADKWTMMMYNSGPLATGLALSAYISRGNWVYGKN